MKNLSNDNRPIGVFDSGLGGLSVLSTLVRVLDYEQYIYYGDSINAPYGIQSVKNVLQFSHDIVNWFIRRDVKAIVIACNTATSVSAQYLRQTYDIPIIGMEPAIKPAVEHFKYNSCNGDKKIAVMATDITLREKKFSDLLSTMDSNHNIIKIPCPSLVPLVEKGIIIGKNVENAIKECFYAQGINKELFDDIYSIVLGCTHFSFLKEAIYNVFGNKISIFDGNEGTAKHLKRMVELHAITQHSSGMGSFHGANGRICAPNKVVHVIREQYSTHIKIANSDIEIYNSLSDEMVEQSVILLDKFMP